jgi:hypothetical protein
MKKIINGKKYDTDTAKFICSTDINTNKSGNHIYVNDYFYWNRDLYLKKTGEYFVHNVNYWDNEDVTIGIQPLSLDQAKRFAESCDRWSKNAAGEYNVYETFFGEVPE